MRQENAALGRSSSISKTRSGKSCLLARPNTRPPEWRQEHCPADMENPRQDRHAIVQNLALHGMPGHGMATLVPLRAGLLLLVLVLMLVAASPCMPASPCPPKSICHVLQPSTHSQQNTRLDRISQWSAALQALIPNSSRPRHPKPRPAIAIEPVCQMTSRLCPVLFLPTLCQVAVCFNLDNSCCQKPLSDRRMPSPQPRLSTC